MPRKILVEILVFTLSLALMAAFSLTAAMATSQKTLTPDANRQIAGPKGHIPSTKGATATPRPFQVSAVTFRAVEIDGQTRLAAAVVFNQAVDPASVDENVNIRLLRKDAGHRWVDASRHGNALRIGPDFITWVSGARLETGDYIMHLRGTLRSVSGLSLDCDGDGKGEGGYLPAYESSMYRAVVNDAGGRREGTGRLLETIEELREENP